jgi:hypothetical protein
MSLLKESEYDKHALSWLNFLKQYDIGDLDLEYNIYIDDKTLFCGFKFYFSKKTIGLFFENYCKAIHKGVDTGMCIKYNIKDNDYFLLSFYVLNCKKAIINIIIEEMKIQICKILSVDNLTFSIVLNQNKKDYQIFWWNNLDKKIFVQKETANHIIKIVLETHSDSLEKIIIYPNPIELPYSTKFENGIYTPGHKYIIEGTTIGSVNSKDFDKYNILYFEDNFIFPFTTEEYVLLLKNESKPTYDYSFDEPYYFDTFVNDFSGKYFEDRKDAMDELTKYLGKVIKLINDASKTIIYKKSKEIPYFFHNLPKILIKYKKNYCHYKEKGKRKVIDKKLSIFTPLNNVKLWSVQNFCFKPFIKEDKFTFESEFNLFNKFEANIIEDEIDFREIAHIFNFIRVVLANNNSKNYKYILSWLANIVQNPLNSYYTPIIIQNLGENNIDDFFKFLMNMVLGNSISFDNLDNFLINGEDGQLFNKVFVKINYIPQNNKKWDNVLRKIVKENFYPIKNNQEIYTKNITRFLFVMKDEYINLNYPIFKCNNDIFDMNMDFVNNKDMANIFFTFLANYDCIDLKNLPKNDDINKYGDSMLPKEFLDLIFQNGYLEENYPNLIFEGIDSEFHIPTKLLYQVYKDWGNNKKGLLSENTFCKTHKLCEPERIYSKQTINGFIKNKKYSCINIKIFN